MKSPNIMVESMRKKIITFSKKGFNIPDNEMEILKKWYFEGAISFKANGYGLQADLYAPCLEDENWEGIYMMTWLKVFRALCAKHGVKTGISKASVNEYCKTTGNYKIYPVISTRLEALNEELEKELLSLV